MATKNPADRAKQFIPFDALRGFREALAERERICDRQSSSSYEPYDEDDAIYYESGHNIFDTYDRTHNTIDDDTTAYMQD